MDLYIETDRLFDHAAALARGLTPKGERSGRSEGAKLAGAYAAARSIHDALSRKAAAEPDSAREWVLDNWYILRREARSAKKELMAAKHLRTCSDGAIICALTRGLVRSSAGEVSLERCRQFLAGAESVRLLRRSELYLFPAALRAAVIEEIADICGVLGPEGKNSAYAPLLGNLFNTLRLFSVLDTKELLAEADAMNAAFLRDPTGEYPRMDDNTRSAYLRRAEELARRAGVPEEDFAKELLKTACREQRHIGFFLFEEKHRGAGIYIAVNVLITLFVTALLAISAKSLAAAFLLLLPASELTKTAVDFVLLHSVKPYHVPRMDMRQGVPPEGRTICVVSALLSEKSAEGIYDRLEELRQGCCREGRELQFGVLADLPVSDTETNEADAAALKAARTAIERLNRKYAGGFYLFTRRRRFDGEKWSGHERKRGALMELAKLLRDEPSTLEVSGERDALNGTRFILTLDEDTRVYPGTVGELIGAMLHPLVRPVLDKRRGLVKSGHGIIHPRIDTDLSSANETDFAVIFSGGGGASAYHTLCGEMYMDAFGSGSFAGKGLIDAEALLACTKKHIPDGKVLSHDALEGAYLRGAYMGDGEFCDSFPAKTLSYYKRLHRWTRGDWQNARWIFAPELRAIERWRLFDSLRRSLIPPATLNAIFMGFFISRSGTLVAAWAALLALLSGLMTAMAERTAAGRPGRKLRQHTRLLTGVGGAIVRSFIRLWLLPVEAWVCFSAAVTAVWRMAVSHKHLLEWQTAAQSSLSGSGLGASIRAAWPGILEGLVLLLFSTSVMGRTAGLMWLLSPGVLFALSLPTKSLPALTGSAPDYVRDKAAEGYKFFQTFCTAREHYLPPDNYQEQPPIGTAHRTSPTNIGLSMTSAVSAMDMGIIQPEECAERIRNTVNTLERMEKCMGHLYNWYDTLTLAPLQPLYISTVDSGNLAAALIVCRIAMEETGQSALASRIAELEKAMDFTPLYDKGRGLMYICYDAAKRRGAGGWYDLMASEAMLTSFIAVARGQVPVEHWRKLSRAQLQKDAYRGLASWTGTMFEYLMPELFLPLYKGSLLYESERFCLYVQKRRRLAGMPWGISESAFYALDAGMSYRYKAHGCPALALKRGQENDLVISPYSSFLALAVEPKAAVQNLRRLEDIGAAGRFGFIEAVDFTPGRCRRHSGEQVRCYMAHHVGMSVTAAANAVCNGSIQRRFMGDAAMRACSLLLEERIETLPPLRRDSSDPPQRPERRQSRWSVHGTGESPLACTPLSNGSYTLTATSRGIHRSAVMDTLIYESSFRMELNGSTVLPGPHGQWELDEERARYAGKCGEIAYAVESCAAGSGCGEIHELTITGAGENEVTLQFRPLLCREEDHAGHPAFWKLGIFAELREGVLLLRRTAREKQREMWLAVTADGDASYSADTHGTLGWLTDPCVTVRTRSRDSRLRFALCAAADPESAVDGAKALMIGEIERGSMVGAAAGKLDMQPGEIGLAGALMKAVSFAPLTGARPKQELWPFGISGDKPLVTCPGNASESESILKAFCLLRSCNIDLDLVYITSEQGEYRRPAAERIGAFLRRFELEALLDAPCGVHFVPESAQKAVESRAVYAVGRPLREKTAPEPPALTGKRGKSVPEYAFEGESFRFTVKDTLPPRAWQHMITNSSFGCIMTEAFCAGVWLKNAREMRFTRPPEDIRSLCSEESIWLEAEGQPISLFAAGDGRECTVRYAPGLAEYEKEISGRRVRARVFIPMGTDARVILVEGGEGLTLRWLLYPVLGSGSADCVMARAENGVFTAKNPESAFPGAKMVCRASGESSCRADFVPAAMDMTVKCEAVTVLVLAADLASCSVLCDAENAKAALEAVKSAWENLLGGEKLRTGEEDIDRYMNSWCAYQTIACRLEGRSSLYQSGGALGFRDQLQDAVNMIDLTPRYARERILDCCRHQYSEGDVMHWWHPHPEGDRGVRTRCSDDMLWLAWALCRYVEKTGDTSLCREREAFLSSAVLNTGERDRYEIPAPAGFGTVLEHAEKAVECCLSRGFGAHGLPHFGSGDWNDALDGVDGESVWLGWFLAECLASLAELLDRLGAEGGERYAELAKKVGRAANAAYNGKWYLRGWYADGTELGGRDRIDSLCQSWAAMSRFSDPDRVDSALSCALERLVDREHGVVKLFDPPYSTRERRPGYIVSYGEGIRENGGQYTHGAIWLARACLMRGREKEGREILRLLLPGAHEGERYEAEPYVLAADVYSAPGHEGEAGWSWYTGSAGWYYSTVREYLADHKRT